MDPALTDSRVKSSGSGGTRGSAYPWPWLGDPVLRRHTSFSSPSLPAPLSVKTAHPQTNINGPFWHQDHRLQLAYYRDGIITFCSCYVPRMLLRLRVWCPYLIPKSTAVRALATVVKRLKSWSSPSDFLCENATWPHSRGKLKANSGSVIATYTFCSARAGKE